MKPYHKYLTDFWVKREKDIEDSLFDVSKFMDNQFVVHAMVCRGGYYGGVNTQSLHLWRWWDHTKFDIKNIKSFVEVGGGYGQMCRIIKGINENPYTIIDLPVINKIQKYFLRNEDECRINYIGLDDLDRINGLSFDMFISVYALSETSEFFVDKIIENNFYNANHFLVGFYGKDTDNFKFSKYIPELKKHGDIVSIDETSSYLFR